MIQATRPRNLQDLLDRAEISDVLNRYSTAVDNRDWPLLRSIFVDELVFDTRSWRGGEPMRMRTDDWLERVKGQLSGFDATRHYTSNHVHHIDGNEATCVANVLALHYLVEGEVRSLHASIGAYTKHLQRTEQGWLIDAFQLIITADQGERDLHARAQVRWATRN